MGNTLIQDSATGNIMGLSPGFIPIGMKEHGGIMYITSVDKEGNGEIGTIPSPIIRDVYKDKTTLNIGQSIPINHENPLLISNKLYPADKFIVNLRMSIKEDDIKGANILYKNSELSPQNPNTSNTDPSDFILQRRVVDPSSESKKYTDIYTPLISYAPDFTDLKIDLYGQGTVDLFSTKGIYKMSLLSSNTNGQKVEESLLNCQVYGNSGKKSKYWFIHSDFPSNVFPKDLLTATLNSDLKQFPSSNKPGKLAVKLETEAVGQFGILPRKDKQTVPITVKSQSAQYTTYFPGFYYSTDSGLYINQLKNIKIIDESSLANIYKNIPIADFSYYFWDDNESPPYQQSTVDDKTDVWDYKDPNNKIGYLHPQTISKSGTNTFILSNIKDITDHESTTFRSSTIDVDEAPYEGIIQVDLGSKYNNWYRLELDYYDQYDNKQGTFIKRFNPYLNDVFGTNLSVDGMEYASSIIMGHEDTFESKSVTLKPDNPTDWINYSTQYQQCISSTYFYSYPKICQHLYGDNRFYSDPVTFYRKKVKESEIFGDVGGTITYKYKGNKLSNDANYTYLYETLTYEDTVGIPHTESFGVKECTLGFGYENDDPNSKEFKKTNSLDTQGENKLQLLIKPDSKASFIKTNIVSNSTNNLFTQLAFKFNDQFTQFSTDGKSGKYTSDSVMYLTLNESTYPGMYTETIPTPRKLSKDVPNSLEFTVVENKCRLLSDGSYEAVVSVKNWYDGRFYRLNYGFPDGGDERFFDDASNFYYWTIGQEGCNNGVLDNFRVRADVQYPSSVTVTRTYDPVEPTYKITPYFCLTGINDSGESVYIQRFGTDGNTDIVYQHNFEYENNEVKNYFNDSFSDSTKSELIQCSYNHQTPFYYYNHDIQYDDYLSAGIYVLNISRVPGIATTYDHLNYDTSLTITINNNSQTFTPGQWRTRPDYTSGIWNPVPSNQYDDLIYEPIVIIISELSRITIETTGGFYRQNIGLFKVNTSKSTDDIIALQNTISAFKDKNIFPYYDYMWELAHQTADLEKVKQYAFIQKYGAFFKEAYVFIDGLINTDTNRISKVTIKGISYGTYPYIPSDPSILPVNLTTEGDYVWNAYVMPEAILDSGQHRFVFSNPLNGYRFYTAPDPKGLRQLISQQN